MYILIRKNLKLLSIMILLLSCFIWIYSNYFTTYRRDGSADRAFDLHAGDRGWISSRNIGK